MKNLRILLTISIVIFSPNIKTSESFFKRQHAIKLSQIIKKEDRQLQKDRKFAEQLEEHLPPTEYQNQAQKDSIQESQEAVTNREQKITTLENELAKCQN